MPSREFKHRLVPGHDVARPGDPVVLVGKYQQLARDAVVLQGFEQRQGLADRTAIVPFAVC